MSEKPCGCWHARVALHEGHCCFRAGTVDDYRPGKPIPCGHTDPDPALTAQLPEREGRL